jgi:glucose-6-phosphate isomerase
MDEHFRTADLDRNMPVICALLGLWYREFFDAQTHAVLPYSQHLALLPSYLQQLDMESNGKSVTRDGEPVQTRTGPGRVGHRRHQRPARVLPAHPPGHCAVPADFIGFAQPDHELGEHHDLLMANFLAQTEALAFGKTREEVAATASRPSRSHRTFRGNTPTSTILATRLTPRTLGALIALYEHKVFVQGAIWDINSFDQWGVELGKALASRIVPSSPPTTCPTWRTTRRRTR